MKENQYIACKTKTILQLIRIERKTNGKIEQAKTLLSIFCLLSDIKLSETELTVLAYFVVYGISDTTRDLILKSEILKGDSLKNTVSKLKKFGLIKKSTIGKDYHMSEKIDFKMDTELAMLIKIDNR